MRVAVVGHCEWVEFVRVERVPGPGDIVHGQPVLGVAAGGGAVAAVHLARWGAECHFYTTFGDDELGHLCHKELVARGVHVHAAFRPCPQRRALTLVDGSRERTIVVIGERHTVRGSDSLPWQELRNAEGVYVTCGDVAAVQNARLARTVVGTARVLNVLREAGIKVDALVGSDNDPAERYRSGDLQPAPALIVRTDGARGGYFVEGDGEPQVYASVPAELSGDTYGAGDAFAAGLTFALALGRAPAEAVRFAAERAAEIIAFEGPYPRA